MMDRSWLLLPCQRQAREDSIGLCVGSSELTSLAICIGEGG